jgi:acyl transferase domain-containing protein
MPGTKQLNVVCLSGLGGNWMNFDFVTLMKQFRMEIADFESIFECASKYVDEIFEPEVPFSFKQNLLNNCYLFQIDSYLGAIALTVVQICQIEMLNKKKVEIDFIIAHSMGEFAAAYAANVLSYQQV